MLTRRSANPVYTMDASHIFRAPLDGSSNGFSLESVNYQSYWMQVQPNGWLTYVPVQGIIGNASVRATATFELVAQAGGGYAIISHHPSFYGQPIAATSNLAGRTCGTTSQYGQSVNITYGPPASAFGWSLVAAIASANQYVSQYGAPYQSENIVIESLAMRGSYVQVQGNAASGPLVAAPPNQLTGYAFPNPAYGLQVRVCVCVCVLHVVDCMG